MNISIIVPFYGILLRVIKPRRMGVAGHVASTGRKMLTNEKTTWVDLDVNGKKEIKLDVKETGWERMDWVHRVQDIDEWRAVVNTVMNFHFQ